MKVPIPKNQYLKKVDINEDAIELEFTPRKKVAMLFVCLNERYWPYLAQVLKDCRKNFLPQHHVDFFIWTDYNDETKKSQKKNIETLFQTWKENQTQENLTMIVDVFAGIVRLYELFYPPVIQGVMQTLADHGVYFKREGIRYWIESTQPITPQTIHLLIEGAQRIFTAFQQDMDDTFKGTFIQDTEAIEWPAPTLMRYHLFLNQEEELKKYDYLFYLDADMRVVEKISDEIMGEGLTAAEHPMYSLKPQLIPPYEPNEHSTAYIKRPGKIVTDETGKKRFKPYYIAGGVQGGKTKDFLEAMRVMKKNIDIDFDNNYTAVWNDESHWNKYVFDMYTGDLIVLGPDYVCPDSLIKEYYEPIWGKSYKPKIITLTKPFSLSAQGADDLKKIMSNI